MTSSKSDRVSPSDQDAQSCTLTVPRHVAIIMDGNGRWATRRGLPRLAGHRAGTENIRPITFKAAELGIRYLTLWAFSTENWRRPREEVEGLLQILSEVIQRETVDLHRHGAQLRHIGSLEGLAPDLQRQIREAIELTKNNDRIVLTIAFNYGGRAEIVQAIRRIIADGIPPEAVDESTIERYLQTAGMPDPDLIIRTSGELRTSNFLLWQAAYAEYYFTPTLWPDFTPEEFEAAIRDFQRRERRFGGLYGPPRPHPVTEPCASAP
ncbi:MAG: isoprenyl transferase [Thermomicrobium sp.]|nr:isoprenyl transferase [Thermomicrobium sp.]MDW7982730.1 isoprenyl transferase [Thermomicrobium sp.]